MSASPRHPRAGTALGIIGGAILGALVASAAPALAQAANQWIQGGGFAGTIVEPKFEFTHNQGEKHAVTVQRELFKVSAEYGEPFAVTVSSGRSTVWYRHPELGVRNVSITGDTKLVHILPREPRKEQTAAERR